MLLSSSPRSRMCYSAELPRIPCTSSSTQRDVVAGLVPPLETPFTLSGGALFGILLLVALLGSGGSYALHILYLKPKGIKVPYVPAPDVIKDSALWAWAPVAALIGRRAPASAKSSQRRKAAADAAKASGGSKSSASPAPKKTWPTSPGVLPSARPGSGRMASMVNPLTQAVTESKAAESKAAPPSTTAANAVEAISTVGMAASSATSNDPSIGTASRVDSGADPESGTALRVDSGAYPEKAASEAEKEGAEADTASNRRARMLAVMMGPSATETASGQEPLLAPLSRDKPDVQASAALSPDAFVAPVTDFETYASSPSVQDAEWGVTRR